MPDTPRYIDPILFDFVVDLETAYQTGDESSVICTRRAIKLVLAGRPVRRCLACGKLALAGKASCLVIHCSAAFLFC